MSHGVTRPGNLQTLSVAYPFAGVTRETALSIPTLKSCRDLIVGAAVQMEPYLYRAAERVEAGMLLTQPDPDTTWIATLAGTVDDLLFYGRGYWLVLAWDGLESIGNPRGFPVRARWIPYTDVTPQVSALDAYGEWTQLDGYDVAGIAEMVEPDGMIRFDSPQPGILAVGAQAIANAVAIEAAARRFADVELPAGVLTNEGTELGQAEADALVSSFEAARQTRTIAFLQGVSYDRTDISAEDLQLIEARANSATEMARLCSVPVTMVGASPSGGASALLYSNLSSQLAVLVSSAVAPHLRTVESTLSLPSVTPRGQRVAFDVGAFLRSDPEAAADYVAKLYTADIVSRDEARAFLGIPSAPVSDLTPGRV